MGQGRINTSLYIILQRVQKTTCFLRGVGCAKSVSKVDDHNAVGGKKKKQPLTFDDEPVVDLNRDDGKELFGEDHTPCPSEQRKDKIQRSSSASNTSSRRSSLHTTNPSSLPTHANTRGRDGVLKRTKATHAQVSNRCPMRIALQASRMYGLRAHGKLGYNTSSKN